MSLLLLFQNNNQSTAPVAVTQSPTRSLSAAAPQRAAIAPVSSRSASAADRRNALSFIRSV